MKPNKDTRPEGFEESAETEPLDPPAHKLKMGKMSKAFEAALDAVENMGKDKRS